MAIHFDPAWVCAVLLCALRVGAALGLTPILQSMGLPVRVRAMLVLAFSLLLAGSVPGAGTAALPDLGGLIAAACRELALGALMGFGIHTAFAAFAFAGNALDIQSGFNIANAIDPITHSQSPLLATLLSMVGLALLFATDMHHALLRALAWSLEQIPPGAAFTLPGPMVLARQFGTVFALGLVLAAPVLFCLFLLEVALAVLSRNLPQMNIFVLSAPVKIAAALFVLGLCGRHIQHLGAQIFERMLAFWNGAL